MKKRSDTAKREAEALRLRRSGKTYKEMALVLGVSIGYAHTLCRNAHWDELRAESERKRRTPVTTGYRDEEDHAKKLRLLGDMREAQIISLRR